MTSQETAIFQHLVAGSRVIRPDGTSLIFGGQPGKHGRYVATGDDIVLLREMCKMPLAQMVEITETALANPAAEVQQNARDPAVHQAAEDAKNNTVLAKNPLVEKLMAQLPQVLATGAATDQLTQAQIQQANQQSMQAAEAAAAAARAA